MTSEALMSQLNKALCEAQALAKQVEILKRRCDDRTKKCMEYGKMVNELTDKLEAKNKELINKSQECEQYKQTLHNLGMKVEPDVQDDIEEQDEDTSIAQQIINKVVEAAFATVEGKAAESKVQVESPKDNEPVVSSVESTESILSSPDQIIDSYLDTEFVMVGME
jgi:hypothetical protein